MALQMKRYVVEVTDSNAEEKPIGYLSVLDGMCVFKRSGNVHDSVIDAGGKIHLGGFGNTIGRKPKRMEEMKSRYMTNLANEAKENLEKDPRTRTYPVYRYKNYSRRSGVYAYALSPDERIIYVYFLGKKRGWYKYDYNSAPSYVIDNMVKRAKSGWGLNRYINKHPMTYYWKGTY